MKYNIWFKEFNEKVISVNLKELFELEKRICSLDLGFLKSVLEKTINFKGKNIPIEHSLLVVQYRELEEIRISNSKKVEEMRAKLDAINRKNLKEKHSIPSNNQKDPHLIINGIRVKIDVSKFFISGLPSCAAKLKSERS